MGRRVASWYLLVLMVPATSLFFSFSIRIRNGQGRSGRVSADAARGVVADPPANSSPVPATGARGHAGDSLSMLTNVRYENERPREREGRARRGRCFPAAGSHTNNDGEHGNVFISRGHGFRGEAIFLYYLDDASRVHNLYRAGRLWI